MSNDNKTLADAAPSVRVRPGDQALSTSEGARQYIADFFAIKLRRHDFRNYIMTRLAADFACALAQYLAAQPSPTDDLPDIASWSKGYHSGYARALADHVARQPVGQISDTEIDARLNALYREMLDSGEHNGGMSGVAWDRAVYRMASGSPAQAADLRPVREALQAAARSLRTIADSTKGTEYLETASEIRAYANSRAICAEKAVIDSQAVGNG